MKGLIVSSLVVFLLILPTVASSQCTPPEHRVWLRCADNGTGVDTIWFGWEYFATKALDTWLCEIELPPAPPSGVFDVRFVGIPGSGVALGQGGQEDYRPYAPGHVDTFKVKFQPGDSGYPFILTWDTALVHATYDSCIIQDEFGGIIVRARMHVTGSVSVTSPALATLLILAYQKPAPGTPPPTRARLHVADAGLENFDLWFGYDPAATPGLDLQLGEFEVPVVPPSGVFYTILKGAGLGMGSFSDYRTQRSVSAIDTHRVVFLPGAGGLPMTLSWSADSVAALCDSAVIVDLFGGILYRARMDLVSSLTVSIPPISELLIIRYGQLPLVGVEEPQPESPVMFGLMPSYPNPFNGETTIRYTLSGGRATLRVYDMLGREVAALVDRALPPGEYTARFDAANLPSGVYFAMLQSGGRMATRKILLLR